MSKVSEDLTLLDIILTKCAHEKIVPTLDEVQEMLDAVWRIIDAEWGAK